MRTAIDLDNLFESEKLDQTPVRNPTSSVRRDIFRSLTTSFSQNQTSLSLELRFVEDEIKEVLDWNSGDLQSWLTVKEESQAEDELPHSRESLARVALRAVKDLQDWLTIGQDEVATLANFAPRSVKNWRDGMVPHPAKVRCLLDLHALVGSLINAIGIDEARVWLTSEDQHGVSRRDRLTSEIGLREVILQASHMLFTPSDVTPLHLLEFAEETPSAIIQRPELFSGPIRRARRRQ